MVSIGGIRRRGLDTMRNSNDPFRGESMPRTIWVQGFFHA